MLGLVVSLRPAGPGPPVLQLLCTRVRVKSYSLRKHRFPQLSKSLIRRSTECSPHSIAVLSGKRITNLFIRALRLKTIHCQTQTHSATMDPGHGGAADTSQIEKYFLKKYLDTLMKNAEILSSHLSD